VIKNAKRLKTLIENILYFTIIENHPLELQKERFNLNEVIILDVLRVYEGQSGSINNKRNSNVNIVFTPSNDFLWKQTNRD